MPRFKIVDVGAMTVGEGEEPYAPLLKAVPCDVIGFEPIAAELEKLNGLNKPGRHFLPYVIGDGSARTFYECNFPMTSSLFEPNTPLLSKFQNLEELSRVTKIQPVQTKRLDDIPEIKGTDFLKVDVQGGELMVFQGAVDVLEDVLVVHTEVEFVPLYKEQPPFADIDAFLRARGFQLHRLSPVGRTFKPLIVNKDLNAMSQVLWADVLYVRNFMEFDRLTPSALLKLAFILHENYSSCDLAAVALEEHDRQTGSHLQVNYLRWLVGPGAA